jgi:hypothetical protein
VDLRKESSVTRTELTRSFLVIRNPVPDEARVVDAAARTRILAAITAQAPPSAPEKALVRRRALRLAGVSVPVGATIVAVLLLVGGGTPAGSVPAAVAKLASQAMQSGAVVHTVVTGDDVEGASGARREAWASIDGSELRYRTTQPDGSFTDVLFEVRGDRTHLTMYRSSDNTLYRYPWAKRDRGPGPEPTPSQLSILGIRDYAAAIKAGNARIEGETTIDGTSAYRVVEKGPAEAPADTQTWFVSKDATSPRLLRIQRPCHQASACAATTFQTYEITQDPIGLRFPVHADARVIDVAPATTTTDTP